MEGGAIPDHLKGHLIGVEVQQFQQRLGHEQFVVALTVKQPVAQGLYIALGQIIVHFPLGLSPELPELFQFGGGLLEEKSKSVVPFISKAVVALDGVLSEWRGGDMWGKSVAASTRLTIR